MIIENFEKINFEKLAFKANFSKVTMKHLFKCAKCNKYTMKESCDCGSKTMNPKPLKYSIDDKFAGYKRKAKLDEYAVRGLV